MGHGVTGGWASDYSKTFSWKLLLNKQQRQALFLPWLLVCVFKGLTCPLQRLALMAVSSTLEKIFQSFVSNLSGFISFARCQTFDHISFSKCYLLIHSLIHVCVCMCAHARVKARIHIDACVHVCARTHTHPTALT